MKKNLYAYFGNFGINKLDIPGHSLYQLALLDSLYNNISSKEFDVFSYVPQDELDNNPKEPWPETEFGKMHMELESNYVAEFLENNFNEVIDRISNSAYDKIFLKARFRNLSTLSKGWNDAAQFEKIIQHAIDLGIGDKVVILDTDLSLSESFIKKLEENNIKRLIPSVDFPVLSDNLLLKAQETVNGFVKEGRRTDFQGYYYGNLKFGNYKKGHSKNEIILTALYDLDFSRKNQNQFTAIDKFPFDVFGKTTDELSKLETFGFHPRWDRERLWVKMEQSFFSVNVSKDLYLREKFIPSRVHEALLFGNIPVSYSPNGEYEWLHPAMQFKTTEDFINIVKFLSESTFGELLSIYNTCVENYLRVKYPNRNGKKS